MATRIPDQLVVLADTTAQAPPPVVLEPVPGCPGCRAFDAQYDASAGRLTVQVSKQVMADPANTVTAGANVVTDPVLAYVITVTGGNVRRYSPPAPPSQEPSTDYPTFWYLPLDTPSPKRMLMVVRFTFRGVSLTRSIEVEVK